MASDGIKFLIELDGKTGGASAAANALTNVGDAAERANRHLHATGRADMHGLTANIFKAEFALRLLERGAEIAWDSVKGLGRTILETINVAAGEGREKLAFENILGDKAGETLEYLDKWSKKTEFGEDAAKGFGAALLDVGYRGDRFHDAMAAIADVASRSVHPLEGAQEALSSLTRMQLTGKLDARTLRGLKLDSRDVIKGLGAALGMTPDAVKKGLEAGSIPAAKAFNAVLDALEKKTGKRLGESGLAAGRKLEAKLVHLRELPEQLMKSLAESPAMEKIGHALDRALEAFNPSGPKGKRIVAGLESLMGTVGSILEKVDWDAAGMHLAGIATQLGTWIEPMSKIVSLLAKIAEGILALPSFGTKIGDWLARSTSKELGGKMLGAGNLANTAAGLVSGGAVGAISNILSGSSEFGDKTKAIGADAGARASGSEFALAEVESMLEKRKVSVPPTAAALPSLKGAKASDKGSVHIGGSTAHVQVNVGNSNASATDIHHAVKKGTEEGLTAAMERQAAMAGVGA